MLNRKEFDHLEKIKQIEYINKTIKESGKTAKDVCKEIGIALSTLSDRFKSIGYRFDRNLRQYTLIAKSKEPQSHAEPLKEKNSTIVPVNKKSVDSIVTDKIEPLKISDNEGRIPTNVSLNVDLKKQLQVYGIMNNKTLSDILNEAGKIYLEKFK